MGERLKDLLMHKDIAKAEKIIKAAKSAAGSIVSGSSQEAIDERSRLELSIMQTITNNQGLSQKNGQSCTDRKTSEVEEVAV